MVVAFLPVRGGSKSIPLKNIKPLCGKPLLCWSIEALERCLAVDSIVVATDSGRIKSVVDERHYTKVKIYHRSEESAADTASTECVMMEYLRQANLAPDTTFLLVQATSPLTETAHFTEALAMYDNGPYDSLLSCVRSYRFFWNADGASLNYDYRHRPRRQEFAGSLMENGAMYINKVGNILLSGNRLSGRIGVYEMPAYTATEIDEPDDWTIIEQLMRRHRLPVGVSGSVRLFLSDVDGTLTDGGMYYSERGDELKKFNTRDGMGFGLLRRRGIKTGIITGEDTAIVAHRARKMKIDYLFQGCREEGKVSVAERICREMGIDMSQVAYIGDDAGCVEMLRAAGVKACPADAAEEVKAVKGILVMEKKGGEGCVREFIDRLLL